MARKSIKPQGRCIFCGGNGLSKEHIWSDWLGALIPSNTAHGEWSASLHRDRGDSETQWIEPPKSRERQGDVLQRKIRNVCEKKCNNGWMSRVVNRAKPFAEQIIRGMTCELDRKAQTELAAWIGITTVMQEFANPRGVRKVPAEDRLALMNNEAPPLSWTIWIAAYKGKWWSPMDHYHIPISYSKGPLHGEQNADDTPRHGLQLLTFTLGEMLVHVFTSTHAEMIEHYRSYIGTSAKLHQLWPIVTERIVWPTTPFSDKEVDALAFDWVQNKWKVSGLPGRPQEIEILKQIEKLAEKLGVPFDDYV